MTEFGPRLSNFPNVDMNYTVYSIYSTCKYIYSIYIYIFVNMLQYFISILHNIKYILDDFFPIF